MLSTSSRNHIPNIMYFWWIELTFRCFHCDKVLLEKCDWILKKEYSSH